MEPGDSAEQPIQTPPPPSRNPARILVLLVVALAVGTAGVLLFRQRGPGSAPGASGAPAPPPGIEVIAAPVKLSPEALLVADRFRCLCGECQDTLGKCTCTRDKGSNDMKAALNRIVAEKRNLAEIEAAMVEKYGPKVLVAPPAPGGSPGK